jgi:hypothetical protein
MQMRLARSSTVAAIEWPWTTMAPKSASLFRNSSRIELQDFTPSPDRDLNKINRQLFCVENWVGGNRLSSRILLAEFAQAIISAGTVPVRFFDLNEAAWLIPALRLASAFGGSPRDANECHLKWNP